MQPSSIDELYRDDRVHRSVYESPGLFDLEMRAIFRSTWVYVGHESEVAHRGDYRTTTIGGEPVILVRSDDDELQVLVNRCMHRAAQVCRWGAGTTSSFRCQYHGWTYKLDGRLSGIPYGDAYDERFNRDDHGLVRLPSVAAYRGLVFASFEAEVAPLETHLGDALEYVDLFLDQCLGHPLAVEHGSHRTAYDGNWKLQLENGVDGYHPNFTHRSFFEIVHEHTGGRGEYLSSRSAAVAKSLGNGHSVLDQRPALGDTYLSRIEMIPRSDDLVAELHAHLSEDETADVLRTVPGAGFNLAIFPNLQLIGVHIREITPIAPNRTDVTLRPLTAPDLPAAAAQLRLRYHEMFYGPAGFGQPDDLEMFDRVQRGLSASTAEWLPLQRGLSREEVEGVVRVGHVTDETPQRAAYQRWQQLLRGHLEKEGAAGADAVEVAAR